MEYQRTVIAINYNWLNFLISPIMILEKEQDWEIRKSPFCRRIPANIWRKNNRIGKITILQSPSNNHKRQELLIEQDSIRWNWANTSFLVKYSPHRLFTSPEEGNVPHYEESTLVSTLTKQSNLGPLAVGQSNIRYLLM